MSEKVKLGRRGFLLAAGAGGAAAAAAVASKVVPQKAEPGTTVSEKNGKGYQVSEHVRNYYRTTQV
jgi:hypothetical protein